MLKFTKDFGAMITLGLAMLGGAASYGALANRVTNMEVLKPKVEKMAEDIAAMRQMLEDLHSRP